jgi:hypothetical protein
VNNKMKNKNTTQFVKSPKQFVNKKCSQKPLLTGFLQSYPDIHSANNSNRLYISNINNN